jgi:hypothetical protein
MLVCTVADVVITVFVSHIVLVKADVVCSIVVVGKLVDEDVKETTEEVVLVSTLVGVVNSVVVCNIVLIEAVVTLDDAVVAKTVEVV